MEFEYTVDKEESQSIIRNHCGVENSDLILVDNSFEEVESINEIKESCNSKSGEGCNNCNHLDLSLEEFKSRVTYQAFKLQPLRNDGIEIISNSSNVETNDIKCSFLRSWINSDIKCVFLIVVAMYNENCSEFESTLEGILNNIPSFTFQSNDDNSNSAILNPEDDFSNKKKYQINNQQMGCVFIVDGIEPFLRTLNKIEGNKLSNKKCLRNNKNFFSQFFNLDVIKEEFITENLTEGDEKHDYKLLKDLVESGLLHPGQEISHVFCQQITYKKKGPLNLIFCVKQQNKRKLNTHLWFFEGFCQRIQPTYVCLLDVGTKPQEKALFYLYQAMEDDWRIAGCCGEIVPFNVHWNPIVSAQAVEYKIAHIMDKCIESVIGYVSVLPGAFSTYRWDSLKDETTLDAYFYSQRQGHQMNLFYANMYLAEDRILCLELMCQKKQWNILRFVKGSIAETDVPSSLSELMAQRRRWINGSWFSMVYTIKNCNRIHKSSHSRCRKFAFQSLMVFYTAIALFNWVLVGTFYVSFCIAMKLFMNEISNDMNTMYKKSTPFIFLYGGILVCLITTSLGVKPKKIEKLNILFSIIFGLYTLGTIMLLIVIIFCNDFNNFMRFECKEPTLNIDEWEKTLAIAVIVCVALMFAFIVLINSKTAVKPLLWGVPVFLFLTGTYVNIFFIYAICNTHDCSWGNRPDKQTEEEKKMTSQYQNERTRWTIVWALCNLAFAYIINYMQGDIKADNVIFIIAVSIAVTFIIFIKFMGGVLYVLDEHLCCCFRTKNAGFARRLD